MKNKSTRSFPVLLMGAFLCSTLFLSSCFTPKPVVRVEPMEEDVRWQYGQAFARQQSNDLEVQAAYNGNNREYLFFDVEVTNFGEEEVLVDPKQFYLEVKGMKMRAADPEVMLLGLDMDASRREANSKNAAVAIGVAAVAATAAIIATSDGNGNSNASNNNNASGNSFDGGYNNLDLAVDLVSIVPNLMIDLSAPRAVEEFPPVNPQDRNFWTDFTLRKTTLRQGERVSGKVLFRTLDLDDRFQMVLPVESSTFRMQFKRLLFQPR
ncbi:MAG: hypothetical protein HRU41_05635 [Saprospiraceae bacterium]|nr:hypothetical protein [Saprospiraceae bacterium]